MSTFSDGMTLKEARDKLRAMVDDGERCPCCTQFAKVYRRKVYSTMARNLIAMYTRFGQGEFRPIDAIGATAPDFVKLRYWGLLVEILDGDEPTGVWKITDRGVAYLRNVIEIPKYVRIYDGRLLSILDGPEEPRASIVDALGTKFNYADLMAGR